MTPLQEIIHYHRGAVRTSEWAKDCRRRPLPPGCRYVHRSQVAGLSGVGGERARAIMRAYPRTRWIVVWMGSEEPSAGPRSAPQPELPLQADQSPNWYRFE